jgi:hypothetical protein
MTHLRVLYAKGTAMVETPDGGRHIVSGGQHWPADDPVVKARPDLFTDDPRYGLSFTTPPAEMMEPPVEDATADPGRKRRVGLPGE